jgi:nitrate reductase (NAD(P)H)
LSKTKWKSATLISIDRVNHDSRNYRFALEYPEQLLGLPTGQHVYARLRRKGSRGDGEKGETVVVQGELVQRAYTPVSPSDARGTLDMLIKVSLTASIIEHSCADLSDVVNLSSRTIRSTSDAMSIRREAR